MKKKCITCGEVKPLTDFHPYKDGYLRNECIICKNARSLRNGKKLWNTEIGFLAWKYSAIKSREKKLKDRSHQCCFKRLWSFTPHTRKTATLAYPRAAVGSVSSVWQLLREVLLKVVLRSASGEGAGTSRSCQWELSEPPTHELCCMDISPSVLGTQGVLIRSQNDRSPPVHTFPCRKHFL